MADSHFSILTQRFTESLSFIGERLGRRQLIVRLRSMTSSKQLKFHKSKLKFLFVCFQLSNFLRKLTSWFLINVKMSTECDVLEALNNASNVLLQATGKKT